MRVKRPEGECSSKNCQIGGEMSLKTWTRDFSPREDGRFANSEVQHIQKLKFILARDDRAEAENYANQTALSQFYGKANDLGRPSDDGSCSTVRVVFHRRYSQNAQDSLRALKFAGLQQLAEIPRVTFRRRQIAVTKPRPKPIRSRKHPSISLLSKLMQQAHFVLIVLGKREPTVF
jgi:hypothetical protein